MINLTDYIHFVCIQNSHIAKIYGDSINHRLCIYSYFNTLNLLARRRGDYVTTAP